MANETTRPLSDGFEVFSDDGTSTIYDIIPPSPTLDHRGGIIADTKTEHDTVEVRIGEDGKGYVPAYPVVIDALSKTNKDEYTPVEDYNPATKKYVDDSQLQSDYNQNDESAKDYIKNRPFYTTDPIETVFFEEQTLSFINGGSPLGVGGVYYEYDVYETTIDGQLIVGDKYKVIIDGNEYVLECYDDDGPTLGEAFNYESGSFDFSIYSFSIRIWVDGNINYLTIIFNTNTSESRTVKIIHYTTEDIQLDRRYIKYIPGLKTEGNTYTINNESITAKNGAEIFNDYTNNVATGLYSHAEGYRTKATGAYAHAEGQFSTASGDQSHAEGLGATASGNYSHAENYSTTATGESSHAEGYSTTASNTATHAEGQRTIASGKYSHAEGLGTEASKECSHAEGVSSKAYGNYSHAEGCGTTASGESSHTEGYSTNATNYYSHAEGVRSAASGNASHAEGESTTASGLSAHAEGTGTKATKYGSHAEGVGSKATADYAHAEGNYTVAEGDGSHTEGYKTTARGSYAHAEGGNTNASGSYSHAEGQNTSATNTYAHAEGLGTTASGMMAHAEGESTTASGKYAHTEGYKTVSSGLSSHAEGSNYDSNGTTVLSARTVSASTYTVIGNTDISVVSSTASGIGSHAEGIQTLAFGYASHAEGSQSNALAVYSHAEGYKTTASGSYAHAEGNGTIASGMMAHAEGTSTTASGILSHSEGAGSIASGAYSHAEGCGTTASGSTAHAEGTGTKASADCAHAEGSNTTASGSCAHAEGNGTTASGVFSHAEGLGTIAASVYQHVQGIFNIEDADGIYAHIIGNGSSNTNRSNAHTVDWNGNAWYAGNVYIGGTGQDDTENIKRLITEDELEESINAIKDYIVLKDQVNGYNYTIAMRDGSLTSSILPVSIEVVTAPTKTSYIEGELLDTTDLVVAAINPDRTKIIINNEKLVLEPISSNSTKATIKYIESGMIYSTTVDITVTAFDPAIVLVDFEYTVNEDGTYTLTAWKETLNGEPSTEMVIPDNTLVIL